MTNTLGALPDEGEDGETKTNIMEAANHVYGMVHKSIVAFQFYDWLTQMLSHVLLSLAALNDLIGDRYRVLSAQEWLALREKIRSRHTSTDECANFDPFIDALVRIVTACAKEKTRRQNQDKKFAHLDLVAIRTSSTNLQHLYFWSKRQWKSDQFQLLQQIELFQC